MNDTTLSRHERGRISNRRRGKRSSVAALLGMGMSVSAAAGTTAIAAAATTAVIRLALVAGEDPVEQGSAMTTRFVMTTGTATSVGHAATGLFDNAGGFGVTAAIAVMIAAATAAIAVMTATRFLVVTTEQVLKQAGSFAEAEATTTLVAAGTLVTAGTTTVVFHGAGRFRITANRLGSTTCGLGSTTGGFRYFAAAVTAAAVNSQHSVEQIETEALGTHAHAEHERGDQNVPLHRAKSPMR